MANPYSIRMLAALNAAPGSHIATVPAGFVWVVKDVNFVVTGVNPGTVLLRAGIGQSLFFFNTSLAQTPGPNYHWTGMAVCYAGEHVEAYVYASTIDISVSGYQLSAA